MRKKQTIITLKLQQYSLNNCTIFAGSARLAYLASSARLANLADSARRAYPKIQALSTLGLR